MPWKGCASDVGKAILLLLWRDCAFDVLEVLYLVNVVLSMPCKGCTFDGLERLYSQYPGKAVLSMPLEDCFRWLVKSALEIPWKCGGFDAMERL